MASGPDELVFVALGGVGEIGMNLYVYGFGPRERRRWLVVDMGITFAGPDQPGIDIIYPDIGFLERERDRIVAIVITHVHEDHFGALAALWPRLKAPVFASPFAAGLIAAKAEAHPGGEDVPIAIVHAGDRVQLGPFEVEFVAVAHSIPEAMALAIRTPLGLVVHTGDWRLDDAPQLGPVTDEERLREIGREGVLAVVGDSTNATRPGRSISEAVVAAELKAIAAAATGRIAFTLFASNVARIRSIAKAAEASGRELVVAGRALWRMIEVATELGYLADLPPFREATILPELPAGNVALILSGSQGERRAALAQVADGTHRDVRLAAGDTMVFSARAIPGNERPIIDIINKLVTAGIRVITDGERPVHTSGHPRRDELSALYEWLRPQILVPVHGEPLHLAAHAELARGLGVPKILSAPNGTVARLAPEVAILADAVPTGRRYLDGSIMVGEDDDGLAERRRLAFAGHVAVSVVLDDRGDLFTDAEVELTGMPVATARGRDLTELVEETVAGTLRSIPRPRRRDRDLLADAIRRSVRAAVAEAWGKKPICTVLVTIV